MKNPLLALLTITIHCFSHQAFGQKTSFVSAVDQDLSVKSMVVIPMVDNLSGIYAKPLGKKLSELVASDRQWTLRQVTDSNMTKPEELEEKPELVKMLLKKWKVDSVLTSRLTKGPQGIAMHLSLFVGKDGYLLAQSSLQNYQGFETADLNQQVVRLYESLKRRIPYDGILLSRKGTLVTVNLGSLQGVKEDQDINVIQIIKIQRHPKFHFVVSADKEILGRIKLKKVEENLSFGNIVTERDEGVIQPGQKFIVEQFVRYHEAPDDKNGPNIYGDKPVEWVPQSNPSFGKIGLLFGLSQYTLSSNLGTSGGLSSTSSLTPTIQASGELWFNPEWFAAVELKQYIFKVSNPSGGSPDKLSISTSQYSLSGGYNFLVADNFFGPKIKLLAGYSKFTSTVDQSSPLTAFTSQTYSGLMMGVGGSFPLELESKEPYSVGAQLQLFLNPGLSETPVDSGDSKSNITSFSAYLEYKYSNRLVIKGLLNYDLFTSSFSGLGTRGETASSSSHAITSLLGGIEYMF